jgi:hypothetical protein
MTGGELRHQRGDTNTRTHTFCHNTDSCITCEIENKIEHERRLGNKKIITINFPNFCPLEKRRE